MSQAASGPTQLPILKLRRTNSTDSLLINYIEYDYEFEKIRSMELHLIIDELTLKLEIYLSIYHATYNLT